MGWGGGALCDSAMWWSSSVIYRSREVEEERTLCLLSQAAGEALSECLDRLRFGHFLISFYSI